MDGDRMHRLELEAQDREAKSTAPVQPTVAERFLNDHRVFLDWYGDAVTDWTDGEKLSVLVMLRTHRDSREEMQALIDQHIGAHFRERILAYVEGAK